MMGRRQFIGKLSDLLISGSRAGFSDAPASPVTPLDFKFHQSPRGPKSYDIGGVGLGIVAALEKSSGGILPRRCVCSPGAIRSGRISGHSINMCVRMTGGGGLDDLEVDCLENYTYVTCHGPNRAFTKVYYDGGLDLRSEHDSLGLDAISEFGGLTESLSSRVRDEEDVAAVFPTLEFLRSCHLCGKNLHGRDIYMYRGEKAFCSSECRSRQIMTDERKEQKCRNEASNAAELSSSPYTKDQIFWTGIIAV